MRYAGDRRGMRAPALSNTASRLDAAMRAPHLHLAEAEAVELLAPAHRLELMDHAIAALHLARQRDGEPGHELPNRNALVIAAAALVLLLCRGPRLAVEGR